MGQVGRVRENRTDTGEHVVDNLQLVQVATLRRGFSNIGMPLKDIHWFTLKGRPAQTGPRGFEKAVMDKFVVVATFSTDADASVKLAPEVVEALRALANVTWQWNHTWKNSNGVATINLGGRMPDGRARNAVVVRHRQLTIEPITENVGEEQE